MDTQTMNVEIGRRIAEIRKAASEKQETTAQYLNMVRSNYTKKELGQSAFSPYELAKLAEHFGVDCHYLITGVKASYYDIHEETGLSNFAIERLRRMSYASESQILKRKDFADGESKRERRGAKKESSNEPKEWVSGSSSATLGDLFKNLNLNLADEAEEEAAPAKKTTRKKKVEETAE